MTWNYRIVKYKGYDPAVFGLHEVYYNKAGEAVCMTISPVCFTSDDEEGPNGIISSLCMALADAIKRPVFEEPEVWGKEDEENEGNQNTVKPGWEIEPVKQRE